MVLTKGLRSFVQSALTMASYELESARAREGERERERDRERDRQNEGSWTGVSVGGGVVLAQLLARGVMD